MENLPRATSPAYVDMKRNEEKFFSVPFLIVTMQMFLAEHLQSNYNGNRHSKKGKHEDAVNDFML